MRDLWKALAAWWMRVARTIGQFQARLLLSIFYLVGMAVFAAAVKLFTDPLQLRRRERSTAWVDRPDDPPIVRARSQS